jgi:hypothetical protein
MKKLTLPVRFGLVTSAVLVAYFLVLALFHKHTNPVFSFLNAIITGFGIYEAIRVYKIEQGTSFSYTEGFKAGFITGFTATLVFTVFFLIYITEVNGNFITEMLQIVHNGGFDITVGMLSFIVGIMGLATTVVATFTVMQLFKNSTKFTQNK